MKVYINHEFHYSVDHLIKTFVKDVEFVETPSPDILVNSVEIKDGIATVKAILDQSIEESIQLTDDEHENKRNIKHANSRVLYDLLTSIYNKHNKWGTLVGVRPVKLVYAMFEAGHTVEEIDELLWTKHRIAKDKRALLINIALKEKVYLNDQDDQNVSLYLCVPFCPSRCLYCSFPSNDMKKKGHLVDAYLDCMHKELDAAYEQLVNHNRIVDCIYIGGGTPSILSADQFETLLSKLDQYFNLATMKEVTIEAGRPDTISRDKLDVFKKHHVSRVCLNPQSMNDHTLGLIGRSHSTQDIKDAYEMIKSYNFNSVNMDIILGLPDEDLEDVKRTLDLITEMAPENITIHTLAVKTSSRLKEKLEEYDMTQSELVEEMLHISEKYMQTHDYYPYYMYRQKNMVGNFENVGYAKDGFESLYNMRIIEEQHDILAIGAGAVTKKCYSAENRFERIANVKGIEDYISRIDDVIKKAATFFDR